VGSEETASTASFHRPVDTGTAATAEVLQELAALFAHVCGTETATISLRDGQGRWHELSTTGAKTLVADVTPYLALARGADLWIVPDAREGEGLLISRLFNLAPAQRFFVGASLRDAEGGALGVLWTTGSVAHQVTTKEQALLRSLVRQVCRHIELQPSPQTSAEAAGELARLASFPEQNPHPVVEFELGERITYQNPAARLHFPDMEEAGLTHPFFAQVVADVALLDQGVKKVVVREATVKDAIYEQRLRRIPHTRCCRIFAYDITARIHAEAARCQLQTQVIRAQAAAMAEMSAPIIPLSNRILLMPLVGTVDLQRAGLVIDALLRGIVQHRARVVILDTTGVATTDAAIADAVFRATRAARLLGSQIILTGIRAEGAQALVALHADLQGVVIYSTVQNGISHALGMR